MREVVLIDGYRTPFAKAGTALADVSARELGRVAVTELLARSGVNPAEIDEVVLGNVAQPSESTNIARVVALLSGIPERVPAFTVQRNCASGLESIAQAHQKIAAGDADLIIAGGAESMSRIPLYMSEGLTHMFERLARAKSPGDKLAALSTVRPRDLKPRIALVEGLTDPVSGLNMGETAEILAKEFGVSREAQDDFALQSHRRTVAAMESGRMAQEMVPVFAPPYRQAVTEDVGPRRGQTLEALAKLKPYFDRRYGTVTVGNSCPITDGAAAILVASADKARELGLKPAGRIKGYAFVGLDPARMGLGPTHATPLALKRAGVAFKDIGLIELNEAFAAQVIANEIAMASAKYCREKLGLEGPIGEIDRSIMNVNGGAIALGHPVGVSGTRLALTLLREMRKRDVPLGLATLCVGGGQGAALVLERAA
ncbi:MAG: thiolase family protein [Candidatus Eisenbacteria bacterium]|uniref:Thiolase family protein n=1 Tax=Eiseniibacteriota bacterium TaxID=2212470 RepID=A0A538SXS6_UNCEI|nr:MAG: thiolase family protein [Candidatus Eisenbacteria bacterium]TMQ63461.1 MAG: thiolase family protein [Candidatus Eisenbacteria bacterium]